MKSFGQTVQDYISSKYGILMRTKDHIVSVDIFAVWSPPDFERFLEDLWAFIKNRRGQRSAKFCVANRSAIIEWLPALQNWRPDNCSIIQEGGSSSRLLRRDACDGNMTLTVGEPSPEPKVSPFISSHMFRSHSCPPAMFSLLVPAPSSSSSATPS